MQKPLIIGIGTLNEGRIDYRLWQMLQARTGATMEQYQNAFERCDLVHDKREARIRAGAIILELWGLGRVAVLLGQDVRRAFGHPEQLVHPYDFGGCTWRQLPYPVASCLWYNDPENRKVAELLLEELYVEYHRRQQEETAT